MNDAPSKFDPRGTPARGGKPRKPLSVLLSKYAVQPNGCWEWTGTRNLQGYGVIGLYIGGTARGTPAPRLQWMHSFGEIPLGMVVMHTCDNPPCINPAHLAIGTQADNLADMRAKGRHDSRGLLGSDQPTIDERYAGLDAPSLERAKRYSGR